MLFLSGMCALIYQVAWLRELRLIFGASTAASAAAVAVFMAGLGIGGLYFGKRADAHRRPLEMYAHLELAISLSAAITPLLVFGARKLYIALGGSTVLGLTGATVVRLILATLVLGIPTFLMGGTLPAASRAVSQASDQGRRAVATLYGVNTFGAVLGAFAANFLLLEVFGTRMTLWLACLINALLGMAARVLAREASAKAATRKPAAEPSEEAVDAAAPEIVERFVWVPPVAAAVAGFTFLLMELVWYRMLGPILGGSSYSFGLILCVALAGIGLGGALYPALGGTRSATLGGFAWTCALEALCIAVPYAAGDRISLVALLLRPFGTIGFTGHVFAWTLVTSVVVLPAAIVSGYQFPLIISLFGRGSTGLGRHVGIAYAANTAGAIAGSLAGGFGLLPLLTAPGCWKLAGALLALTGIASAALVLVFDRRRLGVILPATGCVVAMVLTRAQGPTAAWRHSPVGAGRADASLTNATRNSLIEAVRGVRRTVVWEADGVESSVAVTNADSLSFVVNGKSDGNARIDASTQVMSGLIGAALVGAPETAFVIGLGTGSTAGWLARVPTMKHVQVAELEPVILRVARDCASANEAVLDNPKVSVALGDARELLLTTRSRFDLIFSEPSNPYRAGISSLYTKEFYEAASRVLTRKGVFLQWLQIYDVDGQSLQTAIATLASVFPVVSIWQTESVDLILVASLEPVAIDAEAMRARLQTEPYRTAMTAVWRVTDLEGFLSHHVANPGLARRIAELEGDRVNTDDTNLLEYAFARTVGKGMAVHSSDPWKIARALRLDRPDPIAGPVDWERVDARRALNILPGESKQLPSDWPATLRALYGQVSQYEAGDLGGVRAGWKSHPRDLETPMERAMIAEALAGARDPAALPLIDRVREVRPAEASAILAIYLHAEGKPGEATDALVDAFRLARTDPWPHPELMSRALELSTRISTRDPALGQRLFDALEQPFCIANQNQRRLLTRLDISLALSSPNACVSALAPFEQHPFWTESFLTGRLLCYRSAGDPRAGQAEQDLHDFIASTPTRLGAGLLDSRQAQPAAPAR